METSRPLAQPRRTLVFVGLAVLLALIAVVGSAIVVLDPPQKDIELLALFLSVSGVLSLVAGYLVLRLGWRLPRGGLRLKIALTVAVGIVVALVNVAVTAYLMFLSSHDLALLLLLLSFALLVSLAFGFFLSGLLTSSLHELHRGVTRMAEGDLTTRVAAVDGDEIGDLAKTFNLMAEQVERAFRRQRELEEARRDLIGAVSHDLRTPLASLRVMVEALNDNVVTDTATVQRYLRTMQSEITNLSALINDLFELSQIDAGVLRLQVESSPIEDLLSDTVESLHAQAYLKGVILSGAVPVELEPVLMDPARVQRVLYNLVQNAIRHTPPDGTIVLEARDAGTEVQVSVVDDGEGIAEGDLERVFDRFYRGDPARSRDRGGAGLGLTIARGIIEAHGGRIWVEGLPGRGTRFSFTLPKTPIAAAGIR